MFTIENFEDFGIGSIQVYLFFAAIWAFRVSGSDQWAYYKRVWNHLLLFIVLVFGMVFVTLAFQVGNAVPYPYRNHFSAVFFLFPICIALFYGLKLMKKFGSFTTPKEKQKKLQSKRILQTRFD